MQLYNELFSERKKKKYWNKRLLPPKIVSFCVPFFRKPSKVEMHQTKNQKLNLQSVAHH